MPQDINIPIDYKMDLIHNIVVNSSNQDRKNALIEVNKELNRKLERLKGYLNKLNSNIASLRGQLLLSFLKTQTCFESIDLQNHSLLTYKESNNEIDYQLDKLTSRLHMTLKNVNSLFPIKKTKLRNSVSKQNVHFLLTKLFTPIQKYDFTEILHNPSIEENLRLGCINLETDHLDMNSLSSHLTFITNKIEKRKAHLDLLSKQLVPLHNKLKKESEMLTTKKALLIQKYAFFELNYLKSRNNT